MTKKILGLVQGEYSSHTIRVLEIAKALRETKEYEILLLSRYRNSSEVNKCDVCCVRYSVREIWIYINSVIKRNTKQQYNHTRSNNLLREQRPAGMVK